MRKIAPEHGLRLDRRTALSTLINVVIEGVDFTRLWKPYNVCPFVTALLTVGFSVERVCFFNKRFVRVVLRVYIFFFIYTCLQFRIYAFLRLRVNALRVSILCFVYKCIYIYYTHTSALARINDD